MSTQMIVRIDQELKVKLTRIAKSEGKNVSHVIRDLIEDYIKERDIGSYIDDLWNRVGKKLASRGVKAESVRKAIRDVRAQKR